MARHSRKKTVGDSVDKSASGGDIDPQGVVNALDKVTKDKMSTTGTLKTIGGFDKIPAKVESDKTEQRKKGNNFYREQ